MKSFKEYIAEAKEYVVFIDDGSKYEDPSRKTIKYIDDGITKFGGEFEDITDKGPYFKFKTQSNAMDFINYIKKYTGQSIYAEMK
jgi:hypothetical protein